MWFGRRAVLRAGARNKTNPIVRAIESLEIRRLLSVGDLYAPPADPRTTTDLTAGWQFTLTPGTSPQSPATSDAAWSSVNLPHTWNALDGQNGGANYYRGVGWYRKTVTAPAGTAGDEYYLHFDGASLVANVYVDGVAAGSHAGAFSGFNVDLTAALADGQPHLIAVSCDNSASLANTVPPADGSDFDVYGGIYRGVSLIAVAPRHVSMSDSGSSGVFFTTPAVSAAAATVNISAELENTGVIDPNADPSTNSVVVRSVLVDASGTVVADNSTTQTLTSATVINHSATVVSPHLWKGVLDPYLHQLYVEVRDAATGALLDLVHQEVGIRSFAIDPNQGFVLNGAHYDLHGTNYHQDRLNKGWAISAADTQQDIATLADVGATVVRTHYQLSPLFYQLAEEAGLVVLNEVTFNGSTDRNLAVSHDVFLANAESQMQEMVKQTFNSPSIVSHGIYNELQDNANNDDIVKKLNAFTKALDPTRPTTGASWNTRIGTLEKLTDVVTFNRYYGWFYGVPSDLGSFLDGLHASNPTAAIGITEYGAGAFIGQHGFAPTSTPHGYTQTEEYQALVIEGNLAALQARPWLWESAQFSIFDFCNDNVNNGPALGRSSSGVIQIDHTTKKDPYYLLKANWTSQPVLWLNSKTWTKRTSATTDVKVYSNLGAPTLSVNGVAVGVMQSLGNDIYVMPSYTLTGDVNQYSVSVTSGGVTNTDAATWNCTAVPPPPPTASIKGLAFVDANGNAANDAGDTAAAGATVFLDADSDGVRDTGETSIVAAADGSFAFTALPAGTYHVREVLATGYTLTTALADITLRAGQAVAGVLIGATPPAPTTISSLYINAGGTAAVSGTGTSFLADTAFTAGTAYKTTNTIDTSAITNPAPQAVYQTERYGNFTYAAAGFTPGKAYNVQLDFAENYWKAAGKRVFSVTGNGQAWLTNFDIYAAAGTTNKAVNRTFTSTADVSGKIVIAFQTVTDNAKVNGIEITPADTTTPPATINSLAVNAGGSATGGFLADTAFTGGTAYKTSSAIDTSAVINPAPQSVYQTERYGNFTYAANLTPGKAYNVQLDFAENYWTAAGQRLFSVTGNGAAWLTNFDIFAAAGGRYRAITRTFQATADSNGRITIVFTTGKDNAKINGIEITAGA